MTERGRAGAILRRPAWLGVVWLALVAAAVAADDPPAVEQSELVERATARLAQVDVTVTGPAELIRNLTADDFTVKVGLKKIRAFTVDGFCEELAPAPDDTDSIEALIAAADPRRRPASYVLYFDQGQLTLTGRHRALQLAAELVPELIRDGNRAMLVSNARRLESFTGFEQDPQVLLTALEALEQDNGQWDFYANQEAGRVERIVDAFNRGVTADNAIALARSFQREERWRTERSLRRLESVVARMAAFESPKAVLYFADTTRSNAGDHYLSFFASGMIERDSILSAMAADSTTAWLPFDRVVNLAAALGVRFYSIQAEGLVSHFQSPLGFGATSIGGTPGSSSRTRIRDAQNSLASLSRETGGYAFLNGAPADTIVDRIRTDFSCLYVVSFDPEAIGLDRPHLLAVRVRKPGVQARSRGRLLVQSESARLESRLLAAFSIPEEQGALAVRGSLVPIGFDDGRYSALVQVAVDGVATPDSTWDLGASLVRESRVQAEAQGRLAIEGAGVPAILESEVEFPPGPYEIRSVAHEASTDQVVSTTVALHWPDPRRGPASIGPVALLQPQLGAFSRDGKVRRSGPVALPDGVPVRTSVPTAFVGLVCRGRNGDTLSIERVLRGSSEVAFPAIELAPGGERCVQVRDVVPADTLGPGAYAYEISVADAGRVLADTRREFVAAERGPESAASGAADPQPGSARSR